MRTCRVVSAVVLVALTSAGCASAQEDDAATAARRFYDAVAQDDATGACALLAPRTSSELESTEKTSCEQAIGKQDIPEVGDPRKVEAFGTMAKVTYAGESTFLTRFDAGWRVVAAGCKPQPEKPYDCEIQGS